MIEVTGLEQTNDRTNQAHQLGRAVDDRAIIRVHIPDLPEASAQQACTGSEDVFVNQSRKYLFSPMTINGRKTLANIAGICGAHHGKHEGCHNATQRQIERQCGCQAMQGHFPVALWNS